MALRPPPRAPPFSDYDDVVAALYTEFNATSKPPSPAESDWTYAEIQMWFASGGMIFPPDDPKMRAAAKKQSQKTDLRSPAEIQAEQQVKEVQKAARQAVWFKELTEQDIAKSDMYREAALALGHPQRTIGDLYPMMDETLRALHKEKHIMPFEKHILRWSEEKKEALYAPEGATHGPSAACRGMDMRYFWDASNLSVVGTLRYSLAAVIAWQCDSENSWTVGMVHGGFIEMALDELTAEVMKINLAPENSTAEITFKIKKPVAPDTTYKVEARITECHPPRCMVEGKIFLPSGEVVAECTAKMAMMDRLGGGGSQSKPADEPTVQPKDAAKFSMARVSSTAAGGGGGSGEGGDSLPPAPPAATAAAPASGSAPATVKETVAELQRLQKLLVTQLQNEFFCDDIEPPEIAYGWGEQKLRDYFENGGEE